MKYLLSLFLIFTSITLKSEEAGPLIIGAVVSETGAHAALAADYRKALLLWQEEINAAGGLLGRRVELKLLDDASEAVKAGPLYRQLIGDKADGTVFMTFERSALIPMRGHAVDDKLDQY